MSSLTPVANAILLPGCTLLQNGLTIAPNMDSAQLEGIGRTLNTIGSCGLWWWGDYLCYLRENRGEAQEAHAVETGYCKQSLANAKWVCRNFPLSTRLELSFKHHQEALSECGGENVAQALEWLTKAREGNWSVARMRAEIRGAKGEDSPIQDNPADGPFSFISGLTTWAKGVEAQPRETRERVLADLDRIATTIRATL